MTKATANETDSCCRESRLKNAVAELMQHNDDEAGYRNSLPWRKFHRLVNDAKYWLSRDGADTPGNLRRALLCLNSGLNHVNNAGAYPEGSCRQQQAYDTAAKARNALVQFRQEAPSRQ